MMRLSVFHPKHLSPSLVLGSLCFLVLSTLISSVPVFANSLVRYNWPEYQQIGEDALQHKRYPTAEKYFLKARQELTSHGQENMELASTFVCLGETYQAMQQFDLSEQNYLKGINIQLRHAGSDQHVTAQTLIKLSSLYEHWGRHTQALEAKEKALILDPDITGNAETTISLEGKRINDDAPNGGLSPSGDSLTAAIQSVGQAQRTQKPLLFGMDASSYHDLDWAAYLNHRGLTNLHREHFDDAETQFKMAINRWSISAGPRSQRIPQMLNNLAAVYDLQGRYGESEPYYQEALKLAKLTSGIQSPEFVQIYNNLVNVFRASGKMEALQKLEATYYPERTVTAITDIPINPEAFKPVPAPSPTVKKTGKKKSLKRPVKRRR